QDEGEEEKRHRGETQHAVVDPRRDEHRGDAGRGPRRLLREEGARIVIRIEGRDAARAVHHRESEEEKHEDDGDERKVIRRRARQAELHEVNDRTIAANFSPRSSADENISNDAFAGERRTTSPGRAISRAFPTAAASAFATLCRPGTRSSLALQRTVRRSPDTSTRFPFWSRCAPRLGTSESEKPRTSEAAPVCSATVDGSSRLRTAMSRGPCHAT